MSSSAAPVGERRLLIVLSFITLGESATDRSTTSQPSGSAGYAQGKKWVEKGNDRWARPVNASLIEAPLGALIKAVQRLTGRRRATRLSSQGACRGGKKRGRGNRQGTASSLGSVRLGRTLAIKSHDAGVVICFLTFGIEGVRGNEAAEGEADLPDARPPGGAVDGVKAHAFLRGARA